MVHDRTRFQSCLLRIPLMNDCMHHLLNSCDAAPARTNIILSSLTEHAGFFLHCSNCLSKTKIHHDCTRMRNGLNPLQQTRSQTRSTQAPAESSWTGTAHIEFTHKLCKDWSFLAILWICLSHMCTLYRVCKIWLHWNRIHSEFSSWCFYYRFSNAL